MSAELALFALRLLAGLSLAGFLLLLFFMIWRSLNASERQLRLARAAQARLLRADPAPDGTSAYSEGIALQPLTTIGRAASNTIVVGDDFVSAEHARIVFEQGRWWLEDRASRNGTRLNRENIQSKAILKGGDEIGIGKDRFIVQLPLDPGGPET